MRWEEERYVRLYTRDSTAWLMMRWEARALLPLLLRKLDRIGSLDLGDDGVEGLAEVVRMPVTVVRDGLEDLLKRGSFVMRGTVLVMPNYMTAQEVAKTDAERAKAYRERKRSELLNNSSNTETLQTPESSRDVTQVTSERDASQNVTPNLSVPSLTVPVVDAASPVPPPAPVRSTRRAKRAIDPAWRPSDETMQALRVSLLVDPEPCVEAMRDWAISNDSKKADWDATFRGWVRREAADGKLRSWSPPKPEPKPEPPAPAPPGVKEALSALVDPPNPMRPKQDLQ